MRRQIAAAVGAVIACAAGAADTGRNPLIGVWSQETPYGTEEYKIERIREDGGVEGALRADR